MGNSTHSEDANALQKYNIRVSFFIVFFLNLFLLICCCFFQYVLNVTPDLPNVFEGTGGIQYLQIPITDHWSQNLAGHFPDAIRFIGKIFLYLRCFKF